MARRQFLSIIKIAIIFSLSFFPIAHAKETRLTQDDQMRKSSGIKIVNAQVLSKDKHTRVIFEFDNSFQYHIFSLDNPQRVVLDFPHTQLAMKLSTLPLEGSSIKAIRHSVSDNMKTRIVFDMKGQAKFKSGVLDPQEKQRFRLVVDLPAFTDIVNAPHAKTEKMKTTKIVNPHNLSKSTEIKTSNKTKNKTKQEKKTVRNDKESTHEASKETPPLSKNSDPGATVLPHHMITVVIDPGHGGKDPGATGPLGTHEKDVVLAIAKDLQRRINSVNGMRAVLTRTGDYYLTLRQRLQIARRDHGDFFIAIHADAYPGNDANGASVFALSEGGATSEAARWLAEKENYSELGGIELANKSRLLRSVLIDLSQTATISSSLDAGNLVLHALHQISELHANKVEQARFVVLKSPDIPSLLVETGFITNPFEEKRLKSSAYQQKLADALMEGMRSYYWQDTATASNDNSRKKLF